MHARCISVGEGCGRFMFTNGDTEDKFSQSILCHLNSGKIKYIGSSNPYDQVTRKLKEKASSILRPLTTPGTGQQKQPQQNGALWNAASTLDTGLAEEDGYHFIHPKTMQGLSSKSNLPRTFLLTALSFSLSHQLSLPCWYTLEGLPQG